MADYLDGKVYPVGTAGIEGVGFSFTRPTGITDYSLENAAVALRIWQLDGALKLADGVIANRSKLPPVEGGPTLTLAINQGLTRTTNTAALTEGNIQITQAQLVTLLGAVNARACSYQWVITPVGYGPAQKPLGEGYSGVFAVVKDGYSLEAAAKA